MSNYRSILTRVGIVLIAVGILEFVYFWYYIRHGTTCRLSSSNSSPIPYSSSSALLMFMGVLLLRSNLKAASVSTWFAAFIFSYLASHLVLVKFSFLFSPELWGITSEFWGIAFRIDPIRYFMHIPVRIMAVAAAWWIYTQLSAAPVVSACVRAGHSIATRSKFAFILGIALVAVPVSIGYFYFTPDSAAEAKAVEIARTEYGESYKYDVRAVGQYNGQMQACLNAYNEQEIKLVRVEWEQ